jgi:DNA-directed RNA polymerase specialized sigma24 family protein
MMQQVYKSHQKWLEITESFGVDKDRAKDIVSQMYLRLYQKIKKGQDISYKGQPNYWYIYKMLRGISIDHFRKYQKIEMLLLRIDNKGDLIVKNKEGRYLTTSVNKLKAPEIFNFELYYNKFLNILKQEKQKKSNSYYHQQHFKVFEDIYTNDLSITDYTKLVDDGYYSVYNSYRKVKKIVKDKLLQQL